MQNAIERELLQIPRIFENKVRGGRKCRYQSKMTHPKTNRARRISIQESRILMWRHGASNLRLLANNHTLQASRILEAYRPSNRPGRVRCRRRQELSKRRREFVQIMAYLIDCSCLGLGEISRLVKRICLNFIKFSIFLFCDYEEGRG